MRYAGAAALACALLAGCAGTPHTPPPAPAPDPQAGRMPEIRPPTATVPRRGGYYKDDGPGENIPPPDVLLATPDAVPQVETLHRFANNPYSALGYDFVPMRELKPYRARGRASWYGRKFHGQPTASGEKYDMFGMTAAHPTLPIPSYARVTLLASGKSVVVRVNDRGPFHPGRVIDLSYTAAFKLGYAAQGSAEVEVEGFVPDPRGTLIASGDLLRATGSPEIRRERPPATPLDALEQFDAGLDEREAGLPQVSEARGIFLQLGAFSSAANAQSMREHLARELAWLGDKLSVHSAAGRHRVHAGPWDSREQASEAARRIRDTLKFDPLLITR